MKGDTAQCDGGDGRPFGAIEVIPGGHLQGTIAV